ncbi:hypothetical protein CPC08DRAFT_752477 [Agrocybe pediades]|nr:hypothetical protein CPC08DRAFT_752477 [Agrocybe pediades]
MDPVSTAITVFSICKAINDWIDQLSQREIVIQEISTTVTQIRDILEPFTTAGGSLNLVGIGELQLSQSIRGVGDALEKTREHLMVWKYKKSQRILSFLNPGALIKQLEEDERKLCRQLSILLTSLAVVGYFQDRTLRGMVAGIQNSSKPLPEADDTNSVYTLKDKESVDFWKDYVGAKIDFISEDLFLTRLNTWHGGGISTKTSRLMLMRLDEFNIGGVTPDNLSVALGEEGLKEFVDRYIQGKPKRPSAVKKNDGYGLQMILTVPLLVWIDDEPENHEYNVAFARELGIQVVQLTSTAVAKAWIEDNAAFLQQNDDGSSVRFITDNTRMEYTSEKQAFMNYSAGRTFLQYLRGHLYKAPVLVATTPRSLKTARYVELYDSVGVTTNLDVLLHFIRGLADRRSDDVWWIGYKEENF